MDHIEAEKTIDLLSPITIGRGEAAVDYATLTLREPTAGQLRKAMREPDDIGVLMSLVQQTASVPTRVVEQLSQRDLGECQRFFLQFSSDTQTGLTTSLLNSSSRVASDQTMSGTCQSLSSSGG
ncbi:MAG: phage tail assembly protein [Aquabacterium sp.]